jgi:hypothetical protein
MASASAVAAFSGVAKYCWQKRAGQKRQPARNQDFFHDRSLAMTQFAMLARALLRRRTLVSVEVRCTPALRRWRWASHDGERLSLPLNAFERTFCTLCWRCCGGRC